MVVIEAAARVLVAACVAICAASGSTTVGASLLYERQLVISSNSKEKGTNEELTKYHV